MNIEQKTDTLLLSGITELTAANSSAFRDEARKALTAATVHIDVDLSRTTFVDSSGLGALISLHKSVSARGGALRIVNPAPNVQQILELTRLHRVFEIIRR